MSSLVLLDCGVQHYDWGKSAAESFVFKMKRTSKVERKYAELWVGTHAKCPSKTLTGQLLMDYMQVPSNISRFFSPMHQHHPEFSGKIPFLLKILSIQTALSIQAHPNKKLAEKLHCENPREYKDPNHKPELVVALTPFEALCCFRPLREIYFFVDSIPSLKAVLESALATSADEMTGDTVKRMMHRLYTLDAAQHVKALREHAVAIRVKGEATCTEDRVFLRLMSQHPDDVGCWMVYFMNYVQLEPGQGLFLSDSEPHAYLHGDGVEIMACSDNVVRGGLTSKWKDVPTLLNMLHYESNGLDRLKYERNRITDSHGWEVQYYCPPNEFPDFSLYRMEHITQITGVTSVMLPTVGLGFCLSGNGIVNGSPVREGDCFAVPYGEFVCEAKEKCLLFVASTNSSLAYYAKS